MPIRRESPHGHSPKSPHCSSNGGGKKKSSSSSSAPRASSHHHHQQQQQQATLQNSVAPSSKPTPKNIILVRHPFRIFLYFEERWQRLAMIRLDVRREEAFGEDREHDGNVGADVNGAGEAANPGRQWDGNQGSERKKRKHHHSSGTKRANSPHQQDLPHSNSSPPSSPSPYRYDHHDDGLLTVQYQHETLQHGFADVYRLMGPTHKGKYKREQREYILEYPGVAYVFQIPKKWQDESTWPSEIPVEFQDETTPQLKRILVYEGRSLERAMDELLGVSYDENGVPHALEEPLTHEGEYSPQVILGKGIAFGTQKRIFFGDTTQDVLSCLGTPDQVYYKKHDKLRIFSKNRHQSRSGGGGARTRSSGISSSHQGGINSPQTSSSGPSSTSETTSSTSIDYFYNYFGLGIDILFRGDTHQVRKIVLHTNFCGSKDFNVYSRCNFFIPYREFYRINCRPIPEHFEHQKRILVDLVDSSTMASSPSMGGSGLSDSGSSGQSVHEDENSRTSNQTTSSGGVNFGSGVTVHDDDIYHLKSISPMSKFTEIIHNLPEIHCGQPVANHSTSKDNPFGGTEFYPFKSCIFEVLSNKRINSVTLF